MWKALWGQQRKVGPLLTRSYDATAGSPDGQNMMSRHNKPHALELHRRGYQHCGEGRSGNDSWRTGHMAYVSKRRQAGGQAACPPQTAPNSRAEGQACLGRPRRRFVEGGSGWKCRKLVSPAPRALQRGRAQGRALQQCLPHHPFLHLQNKTEPPPRLLYLRGISKLVPSQEKGFKFGRHW